MVHPYICLQMSPRRASSTDVNGEAEQPEDTAEGEGVFVCFDLLIKSAVCVCNI